MKPSLRIIVATALALSAGTCWAQTKMLLGFTPGNPTMGAFVAKDEGFFARRGLDVTLQPTPLGSTLPAALSADSMQVATLTFPVFLLANEGGVPIQAVAGMSPISDKTPVTGLVAKAGNGLKRPADFAGKKIATPGINGSLHVTFMKWLKNGGVDPKRATYIEMGFPQMNDMMRAGQVDAALQVEPFLRQSTQSGAADFVAYTPVEVMN